MAQYRDPENDQPTEPGWWLASDGKWYPPEARPGVTPPAEAWAPAVAARYCMTCGARAEPYATFCVTCGTALAASWAPPMPSSPGTGPEIAPTSRTDAGLLLGAVGLVVVGSFLPWIKLSAFFGSVTKSGTSGGDGWFAIALVVPLAVFALRRIVAARTRVPGVIALVLSGLLGALVIYEIVDVSRKVRETNDSFGSIAHAEIGIGIWMLLVGTVLAVAGSVLAIRRPRR